MIKQCLCAGHIYFIAMSMTCHTHAPPKKRASFDAFACARPCGEDRQVGSGEKAEVFRIGGMQCGQGVPWGASGR